MVKNWIILGDEAFEDSEMVWGRVEFSRNQQKNWQSILMDQFNNAIEKSVKVREMINNSNFVDFDFNFFVKPKVTDEEVAEFMKPLREHFKDKEISYKVSYNREFSCVFIDFMNVNIQPEEEDTVSVRNFAGEWKNRVKSGGQYKNDCLILNHLAEQSSVYYDETGLPIPSELGYCINLRKLNGEWEKYHWRVVKGKVESGGRHKIVLNGKEYVLLNILHQYEGLGYEEMIAEYKETLHEDSFASFQKYYTKKEYSNKELTYILKENFLYFVMVDNETIAAMPNEDMIAHQINYAHNDVDSAIDYCYKVANVIKSKEARTFVSLNNLSKQEGIVDDSLNIETMVKVGVTIYYCSFEVTIQNGQRIEYKNAACRATDRFATYLDAYSDKSDHQIVLMTLLDLFVLDYIDYSDDGEREKIVLPIYDENIEVMVNAEDRELFTQAAEFITERYNAYQDVYGGEEPEEIISRMVMLDVSLARLLRH